MQYSFRNKLVTGFMLKYMLKLSLNYSNKKDTVMADKPLPDLKTFIENINKKDVKRNGLKIRFAFTKRKRKG